MCIIFYCFFSLFMFISHQTYLINIYHIQLFLFNISLLNLDYPTTLRTMLADTNSSQFILNLLQNNIRLDGRQVFQRRNTKIEFMDNPGSLIYYQGTTEVMIKTTAEIVAPKPERPSQGFIFFKVNCMACPYPFDQNKKNANELTKLLEKVVVGSNSLDPQSLCILTGKFAWQLTVDCIVVRDNGNVFDAMMNGVMAALMDMRKPLLNVQKHNIIPKEKLLPLSIAHTPISLTFTLVQSCILIDPSYEQQQCGQTRITVCMNIYNEICLIHKPGGKGISQNVLSGIIKVCEKQVKPVTEEIRRGVRVRQSVVDGF